LAQDPFAPGRNILLLLIAEAPNLITLDTLARKITQRFVLVDRACRSKVNQQFRNRVNAYPDRPSRGTHAHSFDETTEDSGTVLWAQAVHIAYP